MKTLIIIPTYNEIENLSLLLKEIFSHTSRTNVLIVDDHSPDGTGQLAEEIQQQNTHVHVLHRPAKLGLGTAYIAGFQYAIAHGYDAAIEMDADFSHDPRHLPDFLTAIEETDVVIGSRYIAGGSTPGWSFARRLISGSGNLFARFMLIIPIHDCTGGFRCYRRNVLERLELETVQSRGYAFQVELTYRALKQGFKIVEIPITFRDRRLGTSKMSYSIVIEAFTYVLRTCLGTQPLAPTSPPLQNNELPSSTTQKGVVIEGLLRRLSLLRSRFVGFGLVGIGVMIAGIVLLYTLVKFFKVEQNLAYFIQAVFSIEISFFLNKFINWRDRTGKILPQWIKFHTTKIGTVIFNQALFGCLVYLGIHYLLATLIGVAVSTVINYMTNDKFVFLPTSRAVRRVEKV
jgi:dolichol-phosphate mannosyltransferase